jgi:predicted transcriptional regulator of viral defense system
MTWYLWSCGQSGNPEGVYSHDTALELHELSTWSGAKLHMTVPKNFKRRVIPKVLRLHSGDLRHFEITHINHVPVTTATRTLLDLLKADLIPRHHLIEALQDARDRNLITQNDMTSPFWTVGERRLLKKLADDALVYTTEA